MMNAYYSKQFDKLLKQTDIKEKNLYDALDSVVKQKKGKLGKKLYKTRIASAGKGKSGAYRAIVFYKVDDLLILFHMYQKNEKDNITAKEKKEFGLLSGVFDSLDEKAIEQLVKMKELVRCDYGKENKDKE